MAASEVSPRQTPLEARDGKFFLHGKEFRILSGAMHYFRIHPQYWRDRLLRLKACGLNCVETYIPWNMHEPRPGVYTFEGMLDVRRFVEIAGDLGLYVILRPGPYICAEWEFGGLPSWLLRDPGMKVRSSYQPYLDAVERYLFNLLPHLIKLQASNGGPVLAWQLENEYGSYGRDLQYKLFLRKKYLENGVTELLFTSDNGTGIQEGHVPGELITANFQEKDHGFLMFEYLKNVRQKYGPLMVMEFWSGWFDHWGEKHHVWPVKEFEEVLAWILDQGASVNFYMFHGGTNWGFMNGANEGLGATNESELQKYEADVTSYDYDAPLSENGDTTEKYDVIKRMLKEKVPQHVSPHLPSCPTSIPSRQYGPCAVLGHIPMEDLLAEIQPAKSFRPVTMEELPIHNCAGQSYGFVLYRAVIGRGQQLTFDGAVRDRGLVYINGRFVGLINPGNRDHGIHHVTRAESNTLDILVENMGRVNYAAMDSPVLNDQRKGIRGDVLFDGKSIRGWEIFPLELESDFIKRLTENGKWQQGHSKQSDVVAMNRLELVIEDEPQDTYINMKGWGKGQVFVNGFNLGRYWCQGPPETLYLPAPLLTRGTNQVLIFETSFAISTVTFDATPSLGETVIHTTQLSVWEKRVYSTMKWVTEKWPWSWNVLRLVMK